MREDDLPPELERKLAERRRRRQQYEDHCRDADRFCEATEHGSGEPEPPMDELLRKTGAI